MSESTHGGKGDRQRKVDIKKFHDNWDKIFGDKKVSTEKLDSGFKSSKKSDSK
jgi:hypothetical protein